MVMYFLKCVLNNLLEVILMWKDSGKLKTYSISYKSRANTTAYFMIIFPEIKAFSEAIGRRMYIHMALKMRLFKNEIL